MADACLVSLLELLISAADEAGVYVIHQSVTALSEALTPAFDEHDPNKARDTYCKRCQRQHGYGKHTASTTPCVLRIDGPLREIRKQQIASDRVGDPKGRPGRWNIVADVLSRNPVYAPRCADCNRQSIVFTLDHQLPPPIPIRVSAERWKEATDQDPFALRIREWL
ncbi:hypothetical protein HDU87_008423 [Geranomyces variabilis]|uniref:Uncharacterized protein n=1 Tax=Geranomyces variabilis TaxID=109894 RepID=A0AAD5TCV5_9FUNG|nr:hypothetical protein HDU87_008423 [Geranomyces variabilis]